MHEPYFDRWDVGVVLSNLREDAKWACSAMEDPDQQPIVVGRFAEMAGPIEDVEDHFKWIWRKVSNLEAENAQLRGQSRRWGAA